ncbi:MAG: AmmeMemoRadiSam system protein B [Phycisphaerae bacterium]|nr:AmmeMemoRadiSam system protein B [Phycisphaerae bacterium]NUQ45590.1 AmmeMemoRadiSam system protein B [Phycisphaerae bacterium]
MSVRTPVVAGRFYADEEHVCRRDLRDCLPAQADALPKEAIPVGGIMPHAGWMCSGAVAGSVIAAIGARRRPTTVVIFGAVHVYMGPDAAVYARGAWGTPLGMIEIDEPLAARIIEESDGLIRDDRGAHSAEHSIEVEVPFVQHAWPEARLVPIMVQPDERATTIGKTVGRACRAVNADVVFLGSTDLTHYGPSYGFTPEGIGREGLEWARRVNDRRMIDLMLALRADEITHEAMQHHNACGAGAIAATMAACRELGATRADLLTHTTSFEVLFPRFHQPMDDAVGYAGVVFSKDGVTPD